MNPERAAKNLEVIRTLMERSAVYRRTLAPVMLWAGCCGTLGGVAGYALKLGSGREFVAFWAGVCVVALGGCLGVVRRQALRDGEPFWSLPTRRVAEAAAPPLGAGLLWGIASGLISAEAWGLAALWLTFYGCALHSAGFFMLRGIRLFGWILIGLGAVAFLGGVLMPDSPFPLDANLLMGCGFGVTHLAYALYLRSTERGGRVA